MCVKDSTSSVSSGCLVYAIFGTIPSSIVSPYLYSFVFLDSKPLILPTFGDSILLRSGQSLALECEASGTPRPKLRWLRDGIPLNENVSFSSSRLFFAEFLFHFYYFRISRTFPSKTGRLQRPRYWPRLIQSAPTKAVGSNARPLITLAEIPESFELMSSDLRPFAA